MAALLPDILDRLVELLEGRYVPTRSIARGRFVHAPMLVESLLPQANHKPYPFEVETGDTYWPEDIPHTLSSEQIWSSTDVVVNVLYAVHPDNVLERQKVIQQDIYAMRRTLSDQGSWDSLTGFARCALRATARDSIELPGDHPHNLDVAYIVTVPLVITYREDYTS